MKFILADLKEGVLSAVEGSYEAKSIDVEFPDMLYTQPVQLTGHVEKGGGSLRFQGILKTAIRRSCGKCLKEISEGLERNFDWFFETAGKEEIDPLENVRELLIFEHPLVYVCKANCRGLCPHCGIDRNEGTCNCKENVYHSTPVIIQKEKSKKEKHHGKS
ncbi:MAG TPA: DUF177 domain-containing protein [Candidatus Omnitrophota bacterium]|nr:DUF177 domain-containing protein [Candidatus Omnitrophota bacterium]